jgi:DNA polymerase-3 subunit chi
VGDVYFYHLTKSPIFTVINDLISKCMAKGWRIAIVGKQLKNLEYLNILLWESKDNVFIPHGLSNGINDDDQHVLLTINPIDYSTRQVLIVIDDAEFISSDSSHLERVCILFDGNNFESLAEARSKWKLITGAGIPAQYWSQAAGNWEKKASSN